MKLFITSNVNTIVYLILVLNNGKFIKYIFKITYTLVNIKKENERKNTRE